jgi:hypothetical protein
MELGQREKEQEIQFSDDEGKQKILSKVVHNIGLSTCGQFHPKFMSTFAPIFLSQKSSNLKFKYRKASRETFEPKSRL